jgi:hypothetical protein
MELEGVDISHLEPSFQFHKLGKPPSIFTINEASSAVISIPTENIELHTPPIVTITPSYAEPDNQPPHATVDGDDSGYESEDTTDVTNMIDLSIPAVDDMGGILFLTGWEPVRTSGKTPSRRLNTSSLPSTRV